MANYTVSIFSQSRQSWRTIQVDTLADCVRLTLGLQTEWTVCTKFGCDFNSTTGKSGLFQGSKLTAKYAHALRSLVAQWKRRDYSPVSWFRMDDNQLLAVSNKPKWLYNYDNIGQ